jgi:leucyl aminopeptidase
LASDTPVSSLVPIRLMTTADWRDERGDLSPEALASAGIAGFRGEPGSAVMVVGAAGDLIEVLAGRVAGPAGAVALRGLAARLPEGDYEMAPAPAEIDGDRAAVEWQAGLYRFDRYRRPPADPKIPPRLHGVGSPRSKIVAEACALARDLVNTPANDMGPLELEAAARTVAGRFGGEIAVVAGDDLLAEGYPAVHAVGRAADPRRAPRMIEIAWGGADRPLIAIVGKGVVFDTGGLDIKPSAGMRWMKKDMGGAAHALALGLMIMAMELPVRLRILIPIVENAISGDAMRPGDVLATRRGLSVEVGNTDAEGRLILADALTRAAELEPVLTIDLATLTGAARVALGPDIPPFYTDDEALAADLREASEATGDAIWRMPLWSGYDGALDSDIADLKNDADAWAQAGSVTAALFLKRFAPRDAWVHFDIFAWNPRSRPGWPQGGEAQAIRAIFAMIEKRYPA